MKSVFQTFDKGEANALFGRFKEKLIPAEVQTVTQESGLEEIDVLVEEAFFDTACDILDSWMEEKALLANKLSNTRCPQCHSYHVEMVPHEELGHSWLCKDCGCSFFRKGEG